MLIVSYDFTNNKARAKFAKFLKKFGRKIQYSVFELKNSKRVLQLIINEIELIYKKKFTGADSILIFSLCEGCVKKIKRYGYAANEEKEILFFE